GASEQSDSPARHREHDAHAAHACGGLDARRSQDAAAIGPTGPGAGPRRWAAVLVERGAPAARDLFVSHTPGVFRVLALSTTLPAPRALAPRNDVCIRPADEA